MNLQKLLKQAQQMQEKMQREIAVLEVEASAGGGMVTARMNGQKQLLAVAIEPEVLVGGDAQMLGDLVVAAVNEAGRKIDEAVQSKLGGLAGGLPPGLP